MSSGEANGHCPVSPSKPNADASVCEGSHDGAGEDGEDALDVVTEEESSALNAGLLVILAVLAGVDGVVVDGPANQYNESQLCEEGRGTYATRPRIIEPNRGRSSLLVTLT